MIFFNIKRLASHILPILVWNEKADKGFKEPTPVMAAQALREWKTSGIKDV
jgi:hypothetical protein